MTTESPERIFGLQRETETAVQLIEGGLRELGSVDGANDRVHLHMLLLASGFERLLKLTIALHELAASGEMPTSQRIKKRFGHDVRKLTDEFVRIASRDPKFMDRPACAEDVAFLSSNTELQAVIDALTVFAGQGRYHDLELFLEAQWANSRDPKHLWDDIEMRILRRHPEQQQKLGTLDFNDFYEVLAGELTYLVDRYAQAITRFWTLGSLGRPAEMMLGMIKPFLFLRPEELGRIRR